MKKSTRATLVACAVLACIGLVLAGAGLALGADISFSEKTLSRNFRWLYDLDGRFGHIIFRNGYPGDRSPDGSSGSFSGSGADGEEDSDVFTKERRFETNGIRRLDIDIDAGTVEVITSGDADEIKVDLNMKKRHVSIREEGDTLYIDEDVEFSLWDNDEKVRVTVPEGMDFDEVLVNLDAGQVTIDGIRCGRLELDVDAGQITADDVTADTLLGDVDAGEIIFNGSIASSGEIDCDAGSVEMRLDGEKEDFSYDLSCDLGEITIGDESYEGISNRKHISGDGDKQLTVTCNMGEIDIRFR